MFPIVSDRTFKAIEELKAALTEEFGPDYAYTIMGKGKKIAANNLKDGIIHPKTICYGYTPHGKIGVITKWDRNGFISTIDHDHQLIKAEYPGQLCPCVIKDEKVYMLLQRQLHAAPLHKDIFEAMELKLVPIAANDLPTNVILRELPLHFSVAASCFNLSRHSSIDETSLIPSPQA